MKQRPLRYSFFDAYRGVALILMAIYHFCFDLNQFGVLHENMNYDPFWLNFRAFIMTSFLGLVGLSFAFAKCDYSNKGFRKRLAKVGFCAILVSVVSYNMNPETWIYFGVLHFILFVSLLSPWIIRGPKISLIVGVMMVLVPLFYRSLIFNGTLGHLTGLSPWKPMTEDFSPLFPWMGVTLIGSFVGSQVVKKGPDWAKYEVRFLSPLGRKSLLFYMIHQGVLFPLAWLVSLFQ